MYLFLSDVADRWWSWPSGDRGDTELDAFFKEGNTLLYVLLSIKHVVLKAKFFFTYYPFYLVMISEEFYVS